MAGRREEGSQDGPKAAGGGKTIKRRRGAFVFPCAQGACGNLGTTTCPAKYEIMLQQLFVEQAWQFKADKGNCAYIISGYTFDFLSVRQF